MKLSRRNLLTGAVAGAGVAALAAAPQANAKRARWDKSYSGKDARDWKTPGQPGVDYQPVETPSGVSLPWKIVDGVKVYHMIAEEVDHEFAPGLKAACWGYNGRVHGPTIEAVEGDRVRIYVTNKLIAPTTVHWHGVFLPSGMDGVGGLNQKAILPGETYMYEWTFRQHGTFMYHSHHDEMTQMGMGMMGMIVVHPRGVPKSQWPDREFAMMLSEWVMEPGARRPDINAMSGFNVLTINGKCFPGTAPLVAKTGQRVRMRIGNLSAMDHHPIHMHGHYFRVVATDGGDIHPDAQWPETTVLVAVGTTRDVEFIADEPGDWAMHCHMTHHVMNQMGHGIPNMVGTNLRGLDSLVAPFVPSFMSMGSDGMGEHGTHIESGHMQPPDNSIPMVGAWGAHDYITMGGMFTVVKIRNQLDSYDDPGWYENPPGTQSVHAKAADLERDGIQV